MKETAGAIIVLYKQWRVWRRDNVPVHGIYDGRRFHGADKDDMSGFVQWLEWYYIPNAQ